MTDKATIRVVYLGPCKIQGGKTGFRLATPNLLECVGTWDALKSVTTAFEGKDEWIVGGEYETVGLIEDGLVTQYTPKNMRLVAKHTGDVILEATLEANKARDVAARERAAKRIAKEAGVQQEVAKLAALLNKSRDSIGTMRAIETLIYREAMRQRQERRA